MLIDICRRAAGRIAHGHDAGAVAFEAGIRIDPSWRVVRRDAVERPAARSHALLERGSVGERVVRRSPAGAAVGKLLRLAALDATGMKHVLEDLR